MLNRSMELDGILNLARKKNPNNWRRGQLRGKSFREQENAKTWWQVYLTWSILQLVIF